MNQKLSSRILIVSIIFVTSLCANDYRVSVAIELDQEEAKPLKQKQNTLKEFIKNNLYKTYKTILNPILKNFEDQGLGRSGWAGLSKTDNPLHITLVNVDNLLKQNDLELFKQILTDVKEKIIAQFQNGLGDFYIQGAPSFIGENGWIAYQEIEDPHGNLKKMAHIISEALKTNIPQCIINKDYPIFKPHVSIGLIGRILYPPDAIKKTNPFYTQLLQSHQVTPHNSLLSWIQTVIADNARLDSEVKCNIKNFTLNIADLRDLNNIIQDKQVYELPSVLSAQLIMLKSKLEHLKSKLLLLKDQLKTLKTQLIL